MSFVHLHTHSEFSLLDGLAKIKDLIARAKELDMPAIALTDHGAMHGIIKFYVEAKKAGIKPIIGMEGYLAKRSRHDREAKVDVEPYHIILLAKNLAGYNNLIKLCTIGHLEGFYYKPRLDKEVLREHAQGLIASTACLDGEVPRALAAGNYDKAQDLTREYLDIFGKENFFIEIQKHQVHNPSGRLYQKIAKINPGLLKLAQEFDLLIVATNDIHYVNSADAEAQDALLAIQTKETINAPNRKLTMLDSPDFYLKSQKEMLDLFPDYPEVVENSLKISDLVTDDYQIPMGKMIFPDYQVPNGLSADEYLRKITYERAPEKYAELTEEVTQRIEKELKIIADKGFSSYILIFEDLARFCKEKEILAMARGSAAGSVVQYILDISPLDPIQYKLPFERFLTPVRPTPPDIDLDIEDVHRDTLINYTIEKYGEDKVSQIVTFGTMEARAAVRDVGRVLGLPYSFCDRIAKLILPPRQGFHITIEDSINQVPELNELYKTNPDVKKLLDMSTKLQGVARHAGTHAAGVIIADQPVIEYVPLMQDRKADKTITQYDMYSLDLNAVDDAVGLLKMDYLGLRNLTALHEAIRLVEKNHQVKIDPYKIPLDEKKVFELIIKGDTAGVFQMEGAGMKQTARDLKPDRIEHLMVLVALYRPGPMEMIPQYIKSKNDPQKIQYPHPVLEEVLSDTYGILVYQEQCMEIANVMAGYSLGRGDLLRRAIGKKKKSLMAKEKTAFIKGTQEKGHSEKDAENVFSFIEKFAAYGFNRAHAASYGMLAYQTAYMKALYPLEFFSALMTCERHNTDKIALVINECKRKKIGILPPDINKSGASFGIENLDDKKQGIRFALSAVKNVGDNTVAGIVKERKNNGKYSDLLDVCRRVDPHRINRKSLESLVYAGAMREFGQTSVLLKMISEALEAGTRYQKTKSMGQNTLFGVGEVTTGQTYDLLKSKITEEISEDQLLKWEKEVLGFYLTKHPHEAKILKLYKYIEMRIEELSEKQTGKYLTLGGYVVAKNKILTRKDSREMCFLTLSDLTGNLEVIVFPNTYQNGAREIEQDSILLVQGRLDMQDDGSFKLIANKLLIPDL